MRERDAQPIHALRAVGREARMGFLDPARVPENLREVEAATHAVAFVLSQRTRVDLARGVPPECVRRDDRIGGQLGDRVAQRDRESALGRLDLLFPDVLETFRIASEPEAPLRLDRTGRRVLDPIDDGGAFARGDLAKRVLGRGARARITVSVEGRVGESAVRGNRRRLPRRPLERWDEDRGRRLCFGAREGRGSIDISLNHGITPWALLIPNHDTARSPRRGHRPRADRNRWTSSRAVIVPGRPSSGRASHDSAGRGPRRRRAASTRSHASGVPPARRGCSARPGRA